MTVAELKTVLTDLTRLLATAGVKQSSVTEFTAFANALDRFGEQDLKSFTDLLSRVSLDGTVAPKPGRAKAKTGATAAQPATDLTALAARVKDVYDRAAEEWVTGPLVDELCAKLDARDVSKDALAQVAAGIELKVKSRDANKKIIDAIRSRIKDRSGATTRRQLVERAGGDSNGPPP